MVRIGSLCLVVVYGAKVVIGMPTHTDHSTTTVKAEVSMDTTKEPTQIIENGHFTPYKKVGQAHNLGQFHSNTAYNGRPADFSSHQPNLDSSRSTQPDDEINIDDLPPPLHYTKPFVLGTAKLNELLDQQVYKRQVAENIFAPIATTPPPQIFSRRNNHPVPRKSIIDGNQRPYQTNKFYSNLYLDQQDGPVFTYPYSVWWSQGWNSTTNTTAPYGISVSHVDQSQRVFGPTNSVGSAGNGAIESYLNPVYIRSMNLGATEFDAPVSTMELTQLDIMSVTVLLYANKTANTNSQSKQMMTVPLCLGMGFISGEYNGLTPLIESSVGFASIVAVNYLPNATKYKVTLLDGKRWLIYAWSSVPGNHLSLHLVNENQIQALGVFSGLLQIAKLRGGETSQTNDTTMETLLDRTSGTICTGVSLSGSVKGSTGSYQFNFSTATYRSGARASVGVGGVGAPSGSSDLLMWALPHHQDSFDFVTSARIAPSLQLTSPTKGMMKPVVSNVWTIHESGLPTNITFLPVKPGAPATFPTSALTKIASVARQEIAQDFDAQTNLDSVYFAGKAFSKFANVCLASLEILQDRNLTTVCLEKLKISFSRFTSNRQINKLVYEYSWRGVVSDALYKFPTNPIVDFGNGYYNDHHYHYAYFIHTAAIIAFVDKRLGNSPNFLNSVQPWVDTLIRDVSNPSKLDNYFPISRSFDWWHGHSWATGLFSSLYGKDNESSSQDANFAYALKLWGRITNRPVIEARGNLMLSVLNRTLNAYFLLTANNVIHPQEFIPNKVTGLLSENQVDHTTWFGNMPQYIQGIHMLPLTPITPYIRGNQFVEEEWDMYFSNGRTANIDDGWKGILYGNICAWLPKSSWSIFSKNGFKQTWLDGGASRTWYLVMAGAMGGAQ